MENNDFEIEPISVVKAIPSRMFKELFCDGVSHKVINLGEIPE